MYLCFQYSILLERIKARWRTGGSGPAAPRRGGEATSARVGEGSRTPRLAGPATDRRAPGRASGRALRLTWQGGGRTLHSEAVGEQIGALGTSIVISGRAVFFLRNGGAEGCWAGVAAHHPAS